MQFQIGKLSYNKQEPPAIPQLMKSVTLADSALYTHHNIPLYNPDKLYSKTGSYNLFDEMREDDQVSAVLALFKYIILGAEWDIETEHEEAREFIINNFNGLDEIFIKKLYNILTCMEYGNSLTEKIFKNEDGKIKLANLKTRMPHNFEYVLDSKGNITEVQQSVTGKTIHIKPEKFIHFAYQGEFDNPYGRSALNQGVYRAYWSKNAIIKFWNIYLERHGMPFAFGTYPATAGGSINDFKQVLENIQAKTAVTAPEGFTIDLKEASKGTDNYERAIDKHNMSIARSLLVPDLLGLSGGETGGGSYSLGKEQFNMFYIVVDFMRKQLEKKVTQDIVNSLTFYNFGKDVKAEFKFRVVDNEAKEKTLNLWLQAVNGGKVPITDTHINWFLQSIEAPEIEQSELDEINAKKEEERAAIQGQIGNEDKDEEGKPDEDSDKKKPEKKEKKNLTLFKEYERKVDYVRIENELNDIENRYKDDIINVYSLAINGLVDDIKRKQIIEKKKFKSVKDLTLKHQSKAERLYENLINDSLKAGEETVKKNYIIEDPLILNDDKLAEWVETYAYNISATETERILSTVKPIITEGIRSGSGVTEIVKMIDDALKAYDTTYGASQIETIVRTVTSTGYNEGRLKQFKKLRSEIQAYEFSAILDDRTTTLCHDLHGKRLKPNEVNTYNPPLHFRCRSLLVPIFKDEEFDGNFDIPNVKKTKGSFVELA